MKQYCFSGELQELIENALVGNKSNVDLIMAKLKQEASFKTTRNVDYALSLVQNNKGIKQLRHYLFYGTLIQRNYASLYFNRKGDWICVKQAFELGLIDEIQAFAR